MATKKELKDQALTLAAKLGVSVEVERLNHEALTALVAGLEAKAGGGTASPAPSEAGETLADAPADADQHPPEPELPLDSGGGTDSGEGTTPDAVVPAAAAVLAMRERAAVSHVEAMRGSRFKVAQGCTVFCARSGGAGLREGAPIRDGDFSIDELVRMEKAGAIVRKP